MRNIAIVLAGGTGTRLGSSTPKQFLDIAGKTVLERTIEAFNAATRIDDIIVVMAAGHLDVAREIVRAGRYSKVTKVLEGGAERSESSRIALRTLGEQECNVLIHDAARPLISQRVIEETIETLARFAAVMAAVPPTDTIVSVEEADGTTIVDTVLPRQALRYNHTPQAFRRSVIAAAYEKASQDPDFAATDDCSVVRRYMPEVPIAVVRDDKWNIKITEPSDVHVVEQLFRLRLSADRH